MTQFVTKSVYDSPKHDGRKASRNVGPLTCRYGKHLIRALLNSQDIVEENNVRFSTPVVHRTLWVPKYLCTPSVATHTLTA